MPAATELTQNPRLLHLPLERFQRPINTVGFGELYFRHEILG
jgi:hypothetical protein